MPFWFSNLLFWSLQVALLVLAAGLLASALQLRQPRVLLVYWRLLVAVSLMLPLLQPWHRQNLPAIVVSTDFVSMPVSPTSAPVAPHWYLPSFQTIAPILGIVILAGIALRFGMLALGLLTLRRLRLTSTPIASSEESAAVLQAMRALLAAPAEFRLSSQVDSPVTFGFVRPLVLLPGRFPSLEPRFQSAIACHELLHVRRHDWAHHLGEEVLRALFWFHPAIAWLVSRVRLAREQVVDLAVVRLTNARKSYLEALLVFTDARTGLAAIPAPPFLAERQLVERVSLMLKEVRMSQRRLIASFALISPCLALVIALAAWAFPLKAQGVAGGVSGGVAGGIAKGIANGVSGGISGGISSRASSQEPSVDYSTIWLDTVKRGPMPLQVRGMGTLVGEQGSGNLVARVTVPAPQAAEVKIGQNAAVASKNGPVGKGRVRRIGPQSNDGRSVDIALEAAPQGTTPDLEVAANIDIGMIDNILYVGRPAKSGPNSEIRLFKVNNDGSEAMRTTVQLGRASANTIEVLDGLKEGDKVILSDMSSVANAERIRLTDEKHLLSH
ncbi:MAG TPA: M56 family metallopeptidase [Candidatus Acidoferrum sp.]|nr:M56 family metallopeptidase [Candidatus Acidoferrum sp.]